MKYLKRAVQSNINILDTLISQNKETLADPLTSITTKHYCNGRIDAYKICKQMLEDGFKDFYSEESDV